MPRVTGLLMILVLLLAACSTPAEPSDGIQRPATLAGTAWRVVSVSGRAPIALAIPTATFAADRITGSGGCNSYGGTYRYDPGTGQIEMRDLGMTAMACAEAPRNDFEGLFIQALGRVNLVAIDAQGRLGLSGPGGLIVLERDPQRAVEG
jgi:heat shock protein HslJ